MLLILLQVLVFTVGIVIVIGILVSAIRTFVLPRSAPSQLDRIVFLGMRRLFDLRLHWTGTYLERDRILALYAPFSLLALPVA